MIVYFFYRIEYLKINLILDLITLDKSSIDFSNQLLRL